MWRWRHFELDNLKTVLRAVAQEVAPERARATLVPLGTTSALSWDSLVEVESVVSVVERLADTFYGEALKPALDRYRRGGPLLVLEVRLDLAYYRRLLAMIQGLSGRDRKEAERFLGTLIDSQNVLWAFRYRIYYGLSPEEILNYTLHRGIEIDATTIRAIAEGAHVLEVLRQVWDGRLSNLERLEGLSDEDALDEAERLFDRYLFEQAQRVRNKYAMHLGIVLSYEVLLETEVYDLVSIAEGKVANWSADQIRPYLIAPHN
jgi:V/A-type H+-transporting ATPase subunit C